MYNLRRVRNIVQFVTQVSAVLYVSDIREPLYQLFLLQPVNNIFVWRSYWHLTEFEPDSCKHFLTTAGLKLAPIK